MTRLYCWFLFLGRGSIANCAQVLLHFFQNHFEELRRDAEKQFKSAIKQQPMILLSWGPSKDCVGNFPLYEKTGFQLYVLGTSSIKGKIMIIGGLFHRLCVYSISLSGSIVGKPKHIFDLYLECC